jgi:GntR family transcriptional regulator/MocR family aminotransferase
MKDSFSSLALFKPGCLARDIGVPQYLQLVNLIKDLLEAGSLAPGQLLPSTRELAAHLHVSRKTVLRAYDELLFVGLFDTAKGVGTFVCETASAKYETVSSESRLLVPPFSRYARLLMSCDSHNYFDEHLLKYGASPVELLPSKQWRQCNLEVLRQFNLSHKDYDLSSNRPTSLRLKKTLVGYLSRRKGINCSVEQVKVFNSTTTPIWIIAKIFLDAGESVAMENPGYPYARAIFQAHGCSICLVPVDEAGMCIERLKQIEPPPKLVYITPNHDPLGLKLSLARRIELLEYCTDRGILVLEDDYGYEFDGNYRTLPPLFRMDTNGQVMHLSTFWKTLFPLTTAGFIILPRGLEQAFERAMRQPENSLGASLTCLEEVTLSRFIGRGHLEKHLQQIINVYFEREQALRQAIVRHLYPLAQAQSESASMHFSVKFDEAIDPSVIKKCAEEVNFPLSSIAPYYCESPPEHQFLVSYAHVKACEAQNAVLKFAEKLQTCDKASN